MEIATATTMKYLYLVSPTVITSTYSIVVVILCTKITRLPTTLNTSSVGFRTKTKKGSLCICSYWLSTVGTVGFLGNIIVTNRTGMTRFLLSLHSLTDFFLEFLGVFLRNCSYGVCCTEEAPPVSLFVELKSVANRSWWSGHTSLSLLPVGESGNTSLKKV